MPDTSIDPQSNNNIVRSIYPHTENNLPPEDPEKISGISSKDAETSLVPPPWYGAINNRPTETNPKETIAPQPTPENQNRYNLPSGNIPPESQAIESLVPTVPKTPVGENKTLESLKSTDPVTTVADTMEENFIRALVNNTES